MKYHYKKILILALTCSGAFLFLNNSGGPAQSLNSVSGAPFNGGAYCNGCHSGGSWGTTASLQLRSGSNVVTAGSNYVQGWNYTLRITRGANATYNALANAGWGFQVTCVQNNAPTYTNVNTWGASLPASTAKRTLNSRHYIEHTTKISKSITTLDIPWTGPTGSIGAITFYLALNNVNGDGNTTSDQPVTTSASYTMAPLPVTWLYFNGSRQQNGIALEWATSAEVENGYFTIEKSTDGTNFSTLAKVDAKKSTSGDNVYNYTDEARVTTTAYYRIKQTDLSGNESYFKTIAIRKDGTEQNCTYVHNNEIVVNYESANTGLAMVNLHSIDGRKIAANTTTVYEGMNKLGFAKPEVPGIYLVSIIAGGRIAYQDKIMVQ